MKIKRYKKLIVFCVTAMALVTTDAIKANSHKAPILTKNVTYGLDIPDEDTQYLGYGYDVTKGKAISDPDALMLSNPILDVNNPELIQYEKAFSASQTTYLNYASKSSTEIARQYGMTLGGGISGKIQMVTLDISSKFNTNTSFTEKFEEEYSYYSIYAKNRTVVFQAGADTLSRYLSNDFKEAAKKVEKEEDANNLYEKYGTHLVTGYNLGGIFEMTNYYATKSSRYERQNSFSFNSQVEAAFGAYGAGIGFSFSQNYGSLDNNSFAVNNYKCTTYGGYTFPGLTIDQAFSFYQTAFGAGYIYGLWTDSINAGKNLSIVSIPQSSEMIPLYNLLPSTSEYGQARDLLIEAYIKKCGLSFRQFLEKYPNVNSSREPSALDPLDIGYQGLGLECFELTDGNRQYNSSYLSSDDYSSVVRVPRNSVVAFDFMEDVYYGRKLEWSSQDPRITVLDNRSGVFSVPNDIPVGEYTVTLELDDVQIYQVDLKVANSKYSGGLGTEKSPYAIATKNDLFALMASQEDWDKYFKLENDIDMNQEYNNTKIIGYKSTDGSARPFNGVFDGNYHTIHNLAISKESTYTNNITYGLFGYNTGTIINLNIDCDKDSFDYNSVSNFLGEYTYTTASSNANIGDCDKNIKAAGVLCGINDGRITNCTVADTRLSIALTTESENALKTLGIIVGQNQRGTINECQVSRCRIQTRSDKTKVTYLGGVVGSNTQDNPITYCSVTDTTISATETYTSTCALFAGLLCGYTKGSISDCLVNNSQVADLEDLPKSIQVSSASTEAATVVGISCVVPTTGDNNISLERVFVSNVRTLVGKKGTNDTTYKSIFVTYAQAADKITFSQCYVDNATTYAAENVFLTNTTKDGINVLPDVRWTSVGDILEEDQHWGKDDYGYLCLVKNSITPNDISFDFSKAKKTFYVNHGVGEEFKTGEIRITATTSTGDETTIDNYKVDASNFEKDTLGTWNILVTASGVTAKYQVRAVPVSNIGLSAVKNSAILVDYYEGDTFNPTDLEVHLINQMGIDETRNIKYKFDPTITESELAQRNYFEIENADRELLAGLNVFTISYYDYSTKETLTTSYSIYAKQSVVEGVSIVGDSIPSTGFNLPVGTKTINATDLVGLKIKVNLERVSDIDSLVPITDPTNQHTFTINFDATTLKKNKLLVTYSDSKLNSKEIDANEVEFINSSIHFGTNVVRVCYNGYLLDDDAAFEVNGIYAGLQEKYTEYQNIIENDYSTRLSLNERFTLLQRALALRGELSSLSHEDEYVVLCQHLEQLIDEYNQTVGRINDAAINAIRVSTSFYYNGLINNGVIVFPLAIALVFALI